MAKQQVELEFVGTGTLTGDLREIGTTVIGIGESHKKVQEGIREEQVKTSAGAMALNKHLGDAARVLTVVGKEATAAGRATGETIEQNRKNAAQLIADSKKLTEAQKVQAAAAGGISKEYDALVASSKRAKDAQIAAFEGPLGLLEQIRARIELLEQKKVSLVDEAGIAKVNDELEKLEEQFDAVNSATSRVVNATKPLQQQYRAAVLEAQRIGEEFGKNSPQFLAATEEAARLKKEITDVGARIKALNPGDKVAAFSQLGNAIASGAQAISGAAIALGGNNQELQESLFKFQSLLFAVQGAQSFLRDFKDSFDNIKAVLGLTTVAQEAATAATTADIVAKEGQVVANTAAATSSNALAVAIRAVNAAFASGPLLILAVVAAIALLAIAIVNMGDDAEETSVKFDRLSERLDRAIQRARILREIQQNKEQLDAETRAIEGQGTAEERRQAIRLKGLQDVRQAAEENLEVIARRGLAANRLMQLNVDLVKAANEQDAKAVGEIMEKRLEAAKQLTDINGEVLQSEAALANAKRASANALSDFDKQTAKEALERSRDLARQTLEIQESLAANIIAIEKDIQDRLRALELDRADPREKVALERAAAEEQIALLERNLLREQALQRLRVQIGTEAFAKLSEAQKKARADAIIDAGGVELTLKQEEAVNALRLATEQKFGDELAAILQDEAQTRIDLLLTGQEQERALFEVDLQKKVDRLRLAKRTEAEIIAFEDRERAKFILEQNEKAIALDEQLQTALIESRVRGAESEKEFERRKQLDLLAIKIGAAQASLALIQEDGTKETALRRAQIQATITGLQAEFEKLKSAPLNLNLLDLLGIAEKDQAAVKDALSNLMQSSLQIISQGNAARQAEVTQAIAATDAIISDAQRRRTELQSELDQALDDQRDGYANNADAIRDQIEQTKAVEKEALEEKKRQINEQKKLARQQILIDAASQASSLAASVANLIKSWSTLPFGIGLISAFAQAAGIYAFFQGTKAKINAANRGTQLRKGGALKGRSHEAGGIGMIDRNTGEYMAEAEDGEFVTNKDSYRKRRKLVEAINNDDHATIQQEAIRELLASAGIGLNRKHATDLRRLRDQVASAERGPGGESQAELLEEMRGMRAELERFRKQEGGKPSTTKQGGKTVTNMPGHRVVER